MTKLSELNRDWTPIVVINVTIPVIVIWKLHAGEINQTVALIACWASFVGMNLVYILASRTRDRKKGRPLRNRFTLEVACLAVVMALVTTLSIHLFRPKNRYIALALSNAPLSSIEPERDRLVVELFRKRIIRGKEYASVAAQFKPISPPLYSAASFANIETMNATAAQLKHAFDLDQEYGTQMKGDMDSFRSRMSAVDPVYLQSLMTTDEAQEEARERLLAIEDQWEKSALSLYGYAAAHYREINVHDGSINFSTPELKSSFETRQAASKELQQRMQTERAAALRSQQQAAQ